LGCLFRLVSFLFSASFFILVGAIALATYLLLTASPQPCVDRALNPGPDARGVLETNWLELARRVAEGEEFQLAVSEDQATAIARAYLETRDLPVDGLRVYFCPNGLAEATGSVSVLGLESDFAVGGTLDVSGARPRVEIKSVRAGSFPNFIAKPIVDWLLKDKEVIDLPLAERITAVEIRDGEALVTAAP
jgi:hypothetical protein